MQSTYETSSHNQNVQVQYVYHCCLCLIFDQIMMAQEQKYYYKCYCYYTRATQVRREWQELQLTLA